LSYCFYTDSYNLRKKILDQVIKLREMIIGRSIQGDHVVETVISTAWPVKKAAVLSAIGSRADHEYPLLDEEFGLWFGAVFEAFRSSGVTPRNRCMPGTSCARYEKNLGMHLSTEQRQPCE
jgi:hypothetical protein